MREEAQLKYGVIKEIVGHKRTADVLLNSSHFTYNRDEIKESRCKYLFLVSWEETDTKTWQTFESFEGDTKILDNYARTRALDLPSVAAFDANSPEPIGSGERKKKGCKESKTLDKKNKTHNGDGVIVLSEDETGQAKNTRKDLAETDNLASNLVVTGLKVHISDAENKEREKNGIPMSTYYMPEQDSMNLSKKNTTGEEKGGKSKRMMKRNDKDAEDEEKDKKKKDRKPPRKRNVIEASDESDTYGKWLDAKEEKAKRRKIIESDDDVVIDSNNNKRRELKPRKKKEGIHSTDDDDVMPKGNNNTRSKTTKDNTSHDEVQLVDPPKDTKKSKKLGKARREYRESSIDNLSLSDDNSIIREVKNESKKSMNASLKKEHEEDDCVILQKNDESIDKKRDKLQARKESSDESDDTSEDEDNWEFEWIVTHVPVKEVKDGRDIEDKKKLDWEIVEKSQIPIIFRVRYKYKYQSKDWKIFKWRTIEEMDNLAGLNKYIRTANLDLPLGYAKMMKKNESQFGGNDDIFQIN